ncbi:MAG: M24B family metallopeptidase, partial [Candidatus Eremiobacteraeota bacterium]|nr:M24B family metallopeptidase [Candidatus Eremiobacteraeota bacterium]
REYEVEAIVEYTFAANGAQSPAFPSIVASGPNLGVIHYTSNRDRIPDGSLVLVDAGAEVDYYNGDVTRTWPINGTFTSEQRAVYDVVLAAQLRAIELTKPGAVFNTDVDNGAAAVLVAGLIDLGLLQGSVDEHMTQQTHKRFTVHRIGHWLGMDTHDVGDYKVGGQWRPLEPGMVVTIEPGLYIPDAPDVDARFRGLSVRIEDDALVTSAGCEILTAKAPKKISDIERLIAEGRAAAQALIA